MKVLMFCNCCNSEKEVEMRRAVREYKSETTTFCMPVAEYFCKDCGTQVVNQEVETAVSREVKRRMLFYDKLCVNVKACAKA